MRLVAAVVFVAATLGAPSGAACSLATDTGGLAGGATDASASESGGSLDGSAAGVPDSASASDGAVGVDAAVAGNVIVNGGFELPGRVDSPCASPWTSFQSALSRDTTSHSGAFSCRVCGTANLPYSIDYGFEFSPPVEVGQTVHVRAWLRRVPSGQTTPFVNVTVAVYDSSGNEIDTGTSSPNQPLTDVWTPIDFDATIKTDGVLNAYFTSSVPTGDCFLVDDVSAVLR